MGILLFVLFVLTGEPGFLFALGFYLVVHECG